MVNLQTELATRVRKNIVRALSDYAMIENGDKVMVCVSGGKDSSVLLLMLQEIARRAEMEFTIEACILDQKQPGFHVNEFRSWVESHGIPLHILERDTYRIVTEKIQDGTYCSLCSRLRRAILYDFAFERGFSKIALGHHRDDLLETLMLNIFYSGKLASMPPKLLSDDGRNILLRPMVYVPEADLIQLSREWNFPIIPCNLCGSQEGLKRKKMKQLLGELEQQIPNVSTSLLSSLGNVRPSQLMDNELWNFAGLAKAPPP